MHINYETRKTRNFELRLNEDEFDALSNFLEQCFYERKIPGGFSDFQIQIISSIRTRFNEINDKIIEEDSE